MNLPFQSQAIAGLNTVIDRALQLDRRTGERLLKLSGKRFRVISRKPALQLDIEVTDDTILLDAEPATAPVTTSISGDWMEFAKIVSARDPASALINGNVTVTGDTGPLLELREILSQLDLDWEAPLSRLIGDVAAHQIGRGLRRAPRIAGELLSHFKRQVRDFVVEESGAVPHPIEVEDFSREVEALAERCDRLDARVQQLNKA